MTVHRLTHTVLLPLALDITAHVILDVHNAVSVKTVPYPTIA